MSEHTKEPSRFGLIIGKFNNSGKIESVCGFGVRDDGDYVSLSDYRTIEAQLAESQRQNAELRDLCMEVYSDHKGMI